MAQGHHFATGCRRFAHLNTGPGIGIDREDFGDDLAIATQIEGNEGRCITIEWRRRPCTICTGQCEGIRDRIVVGRTTVVEMEPIPLASSCTDACCDTVRPGLHCPRPAIYRHGN